ncbi:MAG: TonB-dependent receptor [Candidatus Binatia bacterium]|nr:TonB-dependent receptor [Candidatus Binatia bacterium]
MTRFAFCTIFALALNALPLSSNAQDGPIESPSDYQLQAIDKQGPLDGEEYEADAAEAQGEEALGGANTGLSRRATREVEEIVVQARRRDEFLEDTPVAVTALGETELREHGVQRLDGIQQLVPNLTFEGALTGQQVNIRIRGVGTSAPAIAFDPGVGMYIDGVYIPRTFGTLIDVVDVQQIEVLRGPQGTLFGKNTVGGAINVRSVKAHAELEGFAMVRPSNFGSVDTRAMLNLPIIDDMLYSRFAMSTINSQGYYYNTFADTYANDPSNISFLGSLRFLPTDDLTIDVFGTWSRARNHARGSQCVVVDDEPALSGALPPGFFKSCENSSPFEGELNTIGLADTESYGTWGIAEYDIGDVGPLEELSLRGVMSWRQQNPRLRTDIDGTRFMAVQNSSAGGGVLNGKPGTQQQYNPELLLNGSALDSRLSYVVGAFGFFETGFDGRTQSVLLTPGGLNRVTLSETNIDNWTWAVFGQATADITEWASLTGGIRYTQDKKGLTFAQFDPRTDTAVGLPLEGRKVFEAWTPMGSLALSVPEDLLFDTPIDHLMGYFTYSQGFKGGGFNGVSQPRGNVDASQFAFDPETLENFEVGFKTIGFDSMVTMNIALFYGKYDDIQETSIKDLGLDPDGVPIIQRLTLNASRATTKGFEIETMTRPMDGLMIQGNVGYTDATYDAFPNALSDLDGQEIDRTGQSLRATPKLQTFISAQYSFGVETGDGAWLDGWLTPRIEWAYQSAVNWLGPEVPQAKAVGWNAINARLSYDFWDDRAQVALWGKNLLSEEYFAYVTPVISTFGVANRFYEPPRTYGGEVSYRF